MPDQQRVLAGLEREDLFTVVFDQVLTDTAAYADVVLPATTFLEALRHRQGLRRDHACSSPVRSSSRWPKRGPTPTSSRDLLRAARPGGRQPTRPANSSRCCGVIGGMPGGDRRRAARAAAWRRRRVTDGRCSSSMSFRRPPTARSQLYPEALDREAPLGLYALRARPGHRRVSARADLTGVSERTISSTLGELRSPSVHARDASRRRRRARHRRRRRRAGVQ